MPCACRSCETTSDSSRRAGTLGERARSRRLGAVPDPRRDRRRAFAKHRDELSTIFRVPTPAWETVRPAWDKRLTYELARELGIPAPRTLVPRALDRRTRATSTSSLRRAQARDQGALHLRDKVKALRADTRAELDALLPPDVHGHPGATRSWSRSSSRATETTSSATARSSRTAAGREDGRPPRRQRPPTSGARARTSRRSTCPSSRSRPSGFSGDRLLRPRRDRVQARRARRRYKLLDVNPRTWGSHTLGPAGRRRLPRAALRRPAGPALRAPARRPGVRWIRLATDLPTSAVEIWRGPPEPRGRRCGRSRATLMSRPCSAATTRVPGSPRSRSSRT